MDHTKPPCYIAEDLLENLEDEPDSQRRVKEALYPAFTKAQTISEDWLESVELKQRSTDRLPHGDVVHHNWHLRCSVKPDKEAIQRLIETRYGRYASGVVAEGLADYIFDRMSSVLRSPGNPADAVICTAIPQEFMLGIRRVDIKVFAQRYTEPPWRSCSATT